MKRKHFVFPAFLLLLTGCGALPASGPYSNDIAGTKLTPVDAPVPEKEFQYSLIDVTPTVADRLKTAYKSYESSKYKWPGMGGPQNVGLSIGDTITITIYESQSGGLFIPAEAGVRPGNYVSLPQQVIEADGLISVPYAGTLNVLGKTPNQVGKEITERLGARAIEPQVVVSVNGRVGSEVSVVGDVSSSSRFSLGLSGEKILDAIARAGGPKYPGYETNITLQRSSKEWTAPLEVLVEDPSKNIYLQAKDTVYLYREAKAFQAYGAVNQTGKYDFGKRDITLAEAMGIASGMNDDRADPEEVYLYRLEKKPVLEKLGIDPDQMDSAQNTIPTIYKLNFRSGGGFFLAQKFPVQANDILYIANAESVEFIKFLNIINPTSVTKINTKQAITE